MYSRVVQNIHTQCWKIQIKCNVFITIIYSRTKVHWCNSVWSLNTHKMIQCRKIAVVKIQRHTVNQEVIAWLRLLFLRIEINKSASNDAFDCNNLGRSVGVGPMRRPGDRKIDTSPYSSGNIAYLSPPSDSNWRRTSSDSAIHQSLMQNQVCPSPSTFEIANFLSLHHPSLLAIPTNNDEFPIYHFTILPFHIGQSS